MGGGDRVENKGIGVFKRRVVILYIVVKEGFMEKEYLNSYFKEFFFF